MNLATCTSSPNSGTLFTSSLRPESDLNPGVPDLPLCKRVGFGSGVALLFSMFSHTALNPFSELLVLWFPIHLYHLPPFLTMLPTSWLPWQLLIPLDPGCCCLGVHVLHAPTEPQLRCEGTIWRPWPVESEGVLNGQTQLSWTPIYSFL